MRAELLRRDVVLSLLYLFVSAGGAAAGPVFTGLGDLPGGSFISYAFGVSADGSTVVGSSYGLSGEHAFRWTSSGGMVDLGTMGYSNSSASGVSADGSTVAGTAYGGTPQAFRWTSSGGMVGLG